MLRFCMYLLEIEIDIEIISVVVYTHMQNDSIESYKGNVGLSEILDEIQPSLPVTEN